jgi:hypothetical protein
MDFDFYTVKLYAESQSSDEVIIGYFFGKVDGRIDFQFITFARRFKNFARISVEDDINDFREKLNFIYKELLSRTGDVITKSTDFMNYVKSYINKKGGRTAFSKKLGSHISSEDSTAIRVELKDLFDEWTSEVNIKFNFEHSTYTEMSSDEALKAGSQIDVESASMYTKKRNDLLELPDFYPIIDPMEGNPVSSVKVGEMIYVSLMTISNEADKERIMASFPDKFDENGNNIKPFEAFITAREFISKGKGTMLIKVLIDDWFEAKAIIMSSMRIMKDKKHKKLLKDVPDKDKKFLQTLMKGSSVKRDEEALEDKEKFIDLVMIGTILLLLAFVVIVVILILF